MPHFRHARPTFPPHGFGDTFEDLRGRLDVLGALHQHEVATLRSENSRLWSQVVAVVGNNPSCDAGPRVSAKSSRSESGSHIGPSINGTPIASALAGDRDAAMRDLAKSKSFTLGCDPITSPSSKPQTEEPSLPEILADWQASPACASDGVAAAISALDPPLGAEVDDASRTKGSGGRGVQDMPRRMSGFLLVPFASKPYDSEDEDNFLKRFVASQTFELFFGFLIVLNSATMGMQAQVFVQGQPSVGTFMEGCEQLFNLLFTIELAMRVKVYGLQRYVPINSEQMYNFIDAIVVIVTSILCGWFLMFLTLAMPSAFDFRGRDAANVRIITLLRAVRLVRLVRVVQRLEFFKEAWILLRGLSDSVRTLFWTLVFIASITYMFAVFGMVLISKDLQRLYDDLPAGLRKEGEECDAELGVAAGRAPDLCLFQLYFVSMDQVMMTLIQLLTMDDWNSMVKPIMHYKPWCWMFFYCYIAVAVFVLMNLVTAIIVDNALKSSRIDEDRELRDKEEERLAELSNISNLFHMMDTDGDGTLCWDEFKEAFDDPVIVNKWKLLDFQQEDCKELFRLLDNGDGNIDTQEFFDGLRKCKGEAQSKDIFRLQKMLERIETNWGKSTTTLTSMLGASTGLGVRSKRLSRTESERSHGSPGSAKDANDQFSPEVS